MSTYLYMRILESVPRRYDLGIRMLTLGGVEEMYARVAEAAVGDDEAPRVLEIGCGTGSLTRALLARGARVTALDQNADMLAVARSKLGDDVDLVEMAAAEVDGLDAGSYDAVAASLAFSEMSDREQAWVLRAAHKVLRPGGRLVVADEARPPGIGRRLLTAAVRLPLAVVTWLLTQTTTRPLRRWRTQLEQAGFAVVSTERLRRAGVALWTAVPVEPPGALPFETLPLPAGPDWLAEAALTLARWVPVPVRPGVRVLGQPRANSPVFLTGNYALTVRRVSRALRGVDGYLVVADSHGVNVWCAASGGHLGDAQAVTALKLSGLQDRVTHHKVILPQLAATGVQAGQVRHRAGWVVQFGPANAADVPAWLAAGSKKSAEMVRVGFGTRERVEMAVAWATPISVLAAAIGWRHVAGTLALVWGEAFAVFFGWDKLPRGEWLRRAAFAAGAIASALGVLWLSGAATAGTALGWSLAAVAVTGVLTFDYAGSTPVEAAGLFEERRYQVTLDLERCEGVHTCVAVCPEGVFEAKPGSVDIARPDACIRCGACLVQCPQDALSFEGPGGRIGPEVIRRYKLNLLGRRGSA